MNLNRLKPNTTNSLIIVVSLETRFLLLEMWHGCTSSAKDVNWGCDSEKFNANVNFIFYYDSFNIWY